MAILTYFQQECPECGCSLRIPVRWIGQRVRCRHCHATMQACGDLLEGRQGQRGARQRTSARSPLAAQVPHCDDAQLAEWSVLLVEDDRDLLRSFNQFLTCKGYCVTAVHHPRMALEAMSFQPHRIVVMERQLPEYDGPLLMRMLRGYVEDLRAIFLGPDNDAQKRQSLLADGAFAYLPKPCPMKSLETAVRCAFESVAATRDERQEQVMDRGHRRRERLSADS